MYLHKHGDLFICTRAAEDHVFCSRFDTLTKIKHVVVAYEEKKPVGCGAIGSRRPLPFMQRPGTNHSRIPVEEVQIIF